MDSKLEPMSTIGNNEEEIEESMDNPRQHNHHTNNRSNRDTVVKRPMNAFLLWARGERKRVSSDGYGVSQTSLSKLLGETWRHMSVEEKQPFLDMAETLKRQHHIDHPDYKFKPKQRSTTANKTTMRKNSSLTPQRQLSNPISSSTSSSSSSSSSPASSQNSQLSFSPLPNVSPHPVQSNVLAMCQAIIPANVSSMDINNDWFVQLTGQAQSVIVAPIPRIQTSPNSSRRAVRIQIINKHDDIVLPPPSTLLPMTPPPPSTSSSLSSVLFDESTPTLVEYLVNSCNMFHISNHHQQGYSHLIDDPTDYDHFHDPSSNQLTDLDQHYDSSGWIDTPLSNFGTSSTDIVSSSPYGSYDFLCL